MDRVEQMKRDILIVAVIVPLLLAAWVLAGPEKALAQTPAEDQYSSATTEQYANGGDQQVPVGRGVGYEGRESVVAPPSWRSLLAVDGRAFTIGHHPSPPTLEARWGVHRSPSSTGPATRAGRVAIPARRA